MFGHDLAVATADNYRRFAVAAAGRSPIYERLALDVASDPVVLGFLEQMPLDKRQPNLLFAAARYVIGAPPDIASLTELVRRRPADLAATMTTRRTQTNEAARCAVLVPVLAALPGPLALLEVGASAGLTLLPDRYSYDYAGHLVAGLDPMGPLLACRPIGPVPLPLGVPEVVWRAGLDLNPLDVDDPDDVAWLHALVWPGESDRADRLDAAVACARRMPRTVRRGDLLEDLVAVAAEAPPDATLVVYHSAVLAYVDMAKRQAFAATVAALGAVWLSYEAPGVLPEDPTSPGADPNFVVVRDGTRLVAFADDHGSWIRWAT